MPVDIYDLDTKMEAVRQYLITQSMKKVAAQMGIPRGTLQSWKTTEWWKEAYDSAKKQYDVRMDGKLTYAIDLAAEQLLDRIQNGDYHLLKDGSQVRKPINAKEAAMVLAISYDKRALSRGDPTSRTQAVSQTEILKQIGDALRKISQEAHSEEIGQEAIQPSH